MSAFHAAATHVQRRADPLIHAQGFAAHGGADDIHDSVGRAHFVEMHLLHWNVVDLGLGGAQRLKNLQGARFRRFADGRARDDAANLLQPAMRVRMHSRGRLCHTMLVRMRVSMFVGMMLMTVLFARLVFLCADPNIHFSAADAAAFHAADF